MAISVLTNLSDLAGLRALGMHTVNLNRAMERLATGKRVNRAGDDPAAAIAVQALKTDEIRVHKQLERLEFESKYLGARDGAVSVVSDMLQDLMGLTVTAGNTGAMSQAEREALQLEADSILQTINFLATTTTFNGEAILSGYFAGKMGAVSLTPRPGFDPGVPGTATLADIASGGSLNLLTGDLEAAQKSVASAIEGLAADRARFGNRMREIDSETRTLMTERENLAGTRSLLEDADFAAETSALIREQVLRQAALFVIQVARSMKSDSVLTLLG